MSRAPLASLQDYKQRMGWTFPWYSSYDSDFNYDFHATVDERVAPVQIFHLTDAELAAAGMPYDQSMRGDWPGLSVFLILKTGPQRESHGSALIVGARPVRRVRIRSYDGGSGKYFGPSSSGSRRSPHSRGMPRY